MGRREADRLYSDGRKGFLIFGPFQPIDAGHYQLIVRGSASTTASAWIDVVSRKGAVKHAKLPISISHDDSAAVLADASVKLAEPVDDLEVRIWVDSSDNVRLDGYELRSTKTAEQPVFSLGVK
ncbi:MAG: hypothetical protein ACXWT1_19185 [Methylobacter sp.]